jgi:outer membrane protein assembly factor BamE (lipoprotein component of BamABCDE complex)
MKKIIFIFLFFLFSCASGGKVMTAEDFSEIHVGMTTSEIEKKYGKPFSVKELGNDEVEYVYIEKVVVNRARVLQEKHYLIILKNGRVTSTKTQIYNRPSYERNSYEMQTSYKDIDNE